MPLDPELHRHISCTTKVRYESQRHAFTELKRMLSRSRRHADLSSAHRPYHCPFCGAWHIGKRSRLRRREAV